MASNLPRGHVTFVMTDIEGSTRLLTNNPSTYSLMLDRHRALIADAAAEHAGSLFSIAGDGCALAFADTSAAVAFSARLQRDLQAEPWPEDIELRVRIGVHSGLAEPTTDGKYVALALHQSARILACAHGGQTMLSPAVADQLVVPAGCAVEALGMFLVRDFADVVELHELVVGDLPRRLLLPRAAPAERREGNRRSSFVARDDEQDLVADSLVSGPIVTLVGPGGVGKSRLATEVGARIGGSYDEIRLTELAGIPDNDDVAGAIGRSLQIDEPPDGDWITAISAEVVNRRALLIVDNCEHVIDGAAAAIDQITMRCPSVRVLATSREALRVEGEQVMAVRPLEVPSEADSATTLMANPSVRLLVERAVAAGAGPTLSVDELAAAAEITRALDGLPLALELAAARVAELGYDGVQAGLDERFELLSVGRRTAHARQQSLSALVEWSYSLLDASEQQALAAISVTAGSFPADLVRALRGEEPTADGAARTDELLRGLARRSLIESQSIDGDEVFSLLETIRQYGRLRLDEAGLTARTVDRLQRWYLDALDVAPDAVARTYLAVTDDRGIIGSLEHGMGDDPARYGRLVVRVGKFLGLRGRSRDAVREVRRAIELLRSADDPEIPWALLHARLAHDLSRIDDPAAGEEIERAMSALDNLGDPLEQLEVLRQCAGAFMNIGDRERSGRAFVRANGLAVSLGIVDPVPPLGLGVIAGMAGDFGAAREWLERALGAARSIADVDNQAIALGNLTEVALLTDDLEAARNWLGQRLDIIERSTFVLFTGAFVRTVVAYLAKENQPVRAATMAGAAEVLTQVEGIVLPGDTAQRRDELIDQLRASIGEAAFDAAWKHGATLTRAEVLAQIREWLAG